jgi:hypothetical protein
MASETSETKIPMAEIVRILEESIPEADTQRADQLDSLMQLRVAKAAQWERERTRFAALADKGDPFLVALDERLQANTGLVQDLRALAERARTKVPDVDPDTWVLHGRVRDRKLHPVPKVFVGVSETKGKFTSQFPLVPTEGAGYFLMHIPVPKEQQGGKAIPPVFLFVVDEPKVKNLLQDSEPLTPRAGRTDYRELVLQKPGESELPPAPRTEKKTK